MSDTPSSKRSSVDRPTSSLAMMPAWPTVPPESVSNGMSWYTPSSVNRSATAGQSIRSKAANKRLG